MARTHASLCAARSGGSAAFFLGFSLLMFFTAYRDLNQPIPAVRESISILVGHVYCVGLSVYFFLILNCVRERLVLGIWGTEFLVSLMRGVAPATLAPYTHAVREFSLILWLGAALVSLSLLKSALQASPLGASHFRQ